MLQANDMFDMEGEKRKLLIDEAILAPIVRPF
jgi:hypothetical protein